MHWIDIEARVPDDDRYILCSFANYELPAICRYEDNNFYLAESDEPLIKHDIFVEAWMELPKPYHVLLERGVQ